MASSIAFLWEKRLGGRFENTDFEKASLICIKLLPILQNEMTEWQTSVFWQISLQNNLSVRLIHLLNKDPTRVPI